MTDHLKRVSSVAARAPGRGSGEEPVFAKLAPSEAAEPRAGRVGRVLLTLRPPRRRVARRSLFPGLSLSGKNVRESVEQPLKLAATAEAAQGRDARLAGGALGRVSGGGAVGHLQGGAKSWQRGGGRGCRGRRGRRGYLLSEIRSVGKRLWRPGLSGARRPRGRLGG